MFLGLRADALARYKAHWRFIAALVLNVFLSGDSTADAWSA